jgi:hypothetical protein
VCARVHNGTQHYKLLYMTFQAFRNKNRVCRSCLHSMSPLLLLVLTAVSTVTVSAFPRGTPTHQGDFQPQEVATIVAPGSATQPTILPAPQGGYTTPNTQPNLNNGSDTGPIPSVESQDNLMDGCWSLSNITYRGPGHLPDACPLGWSKSGLLCYPNCRYVTRRFQFEC